MSHFSSEQMIELRRFAKQNLTLVRGRVAAFVSGPSAAAVRRVTGPFLAASNGTAAASVPRQVGQRYVARMPLAAVQTMPFLPWVRGGRLYPLALAPTEGALLRLLTVLNQRYGTIPRPRYRRTRDGRWALVLPPFWAPAVTEVQMRDVHYIVPSGSTTQGVSQNSVGQFICPEGTVRDTFPFSDTFGDCVPFEEIGPGDGGNEDEEDVIDPTQSCGPGQHFDEVFLTCICDDPAAMVGPNGGCVPVDCGPGAHLEAGICVPDAKVPPGTVVVVPPGPGPVTPTTTTPTETDGGPSEDTVLLLAAGAAVVVAVGAGILLAKKKKKGKKK